MLHHSLIPLWLNPRLLMLTLMFAIRIIFFCLRYFLLLYLYTEQLKEIWTNKELGVLNTSFLHKILVHSLRMFKSLCLASCSAEQGEGKISSVDAWTRVCSGHPEFYARKIAQHCITQEEEIANHLRDVFHVSDAFQCCFPKPPVSTVPTPESTSEPTPPREPACEPVTITDIINLITPSEPPVDPNCILNTAQRTPADTAVAPSADHTTSANESPAPPNAAKKRRVPQKKTNDSESDVEWVEGSQTDNEDDDEPIVMDDSPNLARRLSMAIPIAAYPLTFLSCQSDSETVASRKETTHGMELLSLTQCPYIFVICYSSSFGVVLDTQ